jgi:hypothetical protein
VPAPVMAMESTPALTPVRVKVLGIEGLLGSRPVRLRS